MSMPRVRRYGRPRPTHFPTSTTRRTMAPFYGVEGLAAAPGTVVDVVDHLPDQVPGQLPADLRGRGSAGRADYGQNSGYAARSP